jgi:hypothetical protein
MDVIQGKFDTVIRLLEQIVDNTSVEMELVDEQGRILSPREIRIDVPSSIPPPSRSTSGEGDEREERDVQIQVRPPSDREQEMWNDAQFDILRIGERHRFLEQRDDRGTLHLHLQYWDDQRNIWTSVHRF